MNEQTQNTPVVETNEGSTKGYPEIMTVAEVKADTDAFAASFGAASEGIADNRQFMNFQNTEELPDGWDVVIDIKDTGSFKDNNAVFAYTVPTMEQILELGEKGEEFIRDCVDSILNRKAGAYCFAVNRDNGAFNMPRDAMSWIETSRPASTGVRALSKKGWLAVNGILVSAINELYKNASHPLRITKKELTLCMSDANFAEMTHPAITNWDNMFSKAEELIGKALADQQATEGEEVTLDIERDTAILKQWASTRDAKADVPELEIVELKI